jgi:hypothetical protein
MRQIMHRDNLSELRDNLVRYIRGLKDDLDESLEAFAECPSDITLNNVNTKMKEIKASMKDLLHMQRRLDNIDSSENNS